VKKSHFNKRMQKIYTKSLKSRLIKHVAMFMGICYMLNLFQHQINPALHGLAHIFESANNLISHQQTSNGIYEDHGHTEHVLYQIDHEHEIIDFVDSLLEHEDDTEETILVESKVDKHINETTYKKKGFFEFRILQTFSTYTKKLENGHPLKAKEPPRAV